MGSLQAFCESEFWDYDLTWNTTRPDFTPCFHKTVLVWIPCGFLWLFAPLETYFLLKSSSRHIPWTGLNIAKLVVVFSLMVLSFLDLSSNVYRTAALGENVPSVEYYTPFIKLVSFLLAVAFILAGRVRGIHSSGVLFLFWFLLSLCGLITYCSYIVRAFDQLSFEDPFTFGVYMIYYPLVVAEFVLSCMADAKPLYREYHPAKDEKECPELNASFLSQLLFFWFNGMAMLGWKRPLVQSDLWSLRPDDRTEYIIPTFDKHWRKELSKKQTLIPSATYSPRRQTEEIKISGSSRQFQPTILGSLCKTFGPLFLSGSIFKLAHDLLQFVSPQLLKLLIGFISSNEPVWKGVFYAVLMFVAATVQSIMLSVYFHRMFTVGMRVRAALISAIYRKALVMSNAARRESTVGEIVNLMSVDAQRITDLLPFLNMIWSAPLQIVLAIVFLWQVLGIAVLAGLATMILMIPINGWIANMVKKMQMKQMKKKDHRVKMMNEILSGIKVLKLYAWEESFLKLVEDTRSAEIKQLKRIAYLSSVTIFLWTCAPFLVSLVSFATYVLMDESNVLTAERAFVALALFNILRFPLAMLPMMITMLIQTSVSLKRMNKYLGSEELDPYVTHDPAEGDTVVIEHGTFSWIRDDPPVLKNISIQIPKGSLVAVVGQVGSGKSSLLSAILGEMDRLEGRVDVKGSIAYVSQLAWIQNATLRDNILFSHPLEEERYRHIIQACALQSDLDVLPGGDMTEIGEKGINLSGGQKQRVSLARAVYASADTYLLDDPLSAVDSHVGKHIFEHVIGPNGVLKGKTRVLVTHGIWFLSAADLIVVMKDGSISETGGYQELLDKKGAFAEFLVQYLNEETVDEAVMDAKELDLVEEIIIKCGSPDLERQLSKKDSVDASHEERRNLLRSLSRQLSQDSGHSRHSSPTHQLSKSDEKSSSKTNLDGQAVSLMDGKLVDGDARKDGTKLIQTETAETGEVKMQVYMEYFKAIGLWWVFAVAVSQIAHQAFSVGSSMWLSQWSNDKPNPDGSQDESLRNLRLGIYGALGAGQAFGILVGSFALSLGTLKGAQAIHSTMLLNILRSPMSFFDTTPLGRIVNRFAKDIDTVDVTIPQTLRSWMACLLQVLATLFIISYETPIFMAVILPVGFIYYFIQKFYVATSRQLKRLESITRSPIYSHFSETLAGVSTIRAYGSTNRFIRESNTLVDTNLTCYFPSIVSNRWLAIRLEFCGNAIILFAALFAVLGRENLSPGTVGLSVSYALSVTATLNWLVRMSSELETNIVSVERILEYSTTPTEAPWEIEQTKPDPSWPSQGEVTFNHYSTCYREGLDLILKGITCTVHPGEKVGIVGRTGAGKSSLTLSLFRIIEAVGGNILIDGVDIAKIGLHSLRSVLTIIPQDPVLFSGTLRMNLDPFLRHQDSEIWEALELSHLKSFVCSHPMGLDFEVAEGGENLSVGQRQLVCLARALLRKTKVLVLDEATAAVDLETDDLIQATIRKEFASCSVLTIAHRLQTIIDYDRVVVLDRGEIAEFASPQSLLQDEASMFYSMAKDAGLV